MKMIPGGAPTVAELQVHPVGSPPRPEWLSIPGGSSIRAAPLVAVAVSVGLIVARESAALSEK